MHAAETNLPSGIIEVHDEITALLPIASIVPDTQAEETYFPQGITSWQKLVIVSEVKVQTEETYFPVGIIEEQVPISVFFPVALEEPGEQGDLTYDPLLGTEHTSVTKSLPKEL
jgi:hypothetical protein